MWTCLGSTQLLLERESKVKSYTFLSFFWKLTWEVYKNSSSAHGKIYRRLRAWTLVAIVDLIFAYEVITFLPYPRAPVQQQEEYHAYSQQANRISAMRERCERCLGAVVFGGSTKLLMHGQGCSVSKTC